MFKLIDFERFLDNAVGGVLKERSFVKSNRTARYKNDAIDKLRKTPGNLF